jgi:alkanesulfonate monooxygenase SsuD/methylene tetrahydromethanopterin reductase-like flavin-dependent oxidoreductase (luciferase family)
MTGTRVSVVIPTASAIDLVRVAPLAEDYAVDLWVGSPGEMGPSDDAVLVVAAGVAAVTTDLRIGVCVDLGGPAHPIRLAEDLSVVDQASGGRLEVAFRRRSSELPTWLGRLETTLSSWDGIRIGPDREVAVTPRPAQPWLPRLVVGADDAGAAARLHAGAMLRPGETAVDRCGRTVLIVELGGRLRDRVAVAPRAFVESIRTEVASAGAQQVLVALSPGTGEDFNDDIRMLGVFLAPAIRCAAHQLDFIEADAWNWMTALTELHEVPE